jgi:signal transduction histidine kinase
MTLRPLANRVSLVQLSLTLVALATVSIGTVIVVQVLLERKADHLLEGSVARVARFAAYVAPETLDAAWMEGEISEVRPSEVRIELRDAGGRVIASGGPGASVGPVSLGCQSLGSRRACARVVGPFTVVAAVDRSPDFETQARVGLSLFAVAAITALLTGLLSQRFARRALAPLTQLTARIAEIEPGTGSRVLAVREFSELESLRTRFDQLITRFDDALARERRLAAQASHELRTPLGVARAEIEALPELPEVQTGRTNALRAMDRLSQLVEALLWFARAQRRFDASDVGIVNLADTLRVQLAERGQVHAGVSITHRLPDEMLVRGDETLLGRVAANLLDNAFKHGDGKRVEVLCEHPRNDLLRIRVINSGRGPSPECAARLFEPFYRDARAANAPGFGLGLAFAREVARAHGGEVQWTGDHTDTTEFVLTLPLLHWSEAPMEPASVNLNAG